MAENSSSHRQHGPRPNNLQVEGIPEDASDDNEVQSNQENDPIIAGMLPTNPAQSILPPGETPISWYVRSQGALNAVYTQLCAQTAPLTQSRRPGSRAHASQREESTYEGTEVYARSTSQHIQTGTHRSSGEVLWVHGGAPAHPNVSVRNV